MPTPARTSPAKPSISKTTDDSQEQIRRRAYELYELRGKEDGHDLDDWLQAESEVHPTAKTMAA